MDVGGGVRGVYKIRAPKCLSGQAVTGDRWGTGNDDVCELMDGDCFVTAWSLLMLNVVVLMR